MKDWIIIVGTLLILIIVIDGIRRKRNDRYGKIRLSPNMKKRVTNIPNSVAEEKPIAVSELPNGGARVVGHRNTSDSGKGLPNPSSHSPKKIESTISHKNRKPEQTQLNLDESVPMLMESVADSRLSMEDRVEPHFSETNDGFQSNNHEFNSDKNQISLSDSDYDGEGSEDDQYDDEEDTDYDDDTEEYEYDYDDESSESSTTLSTPEPEEVLIVHVMAKEQLLKGGELLSQILKCGMRYGNMNIFHRYSDGKGEGTLLFSMANMVKPGVFDLEAMDHFETPGISFFMTLPVEADSLQVFEMMIETAQSVAQALNAELKDDQRSDMTKQTLEHCRQRIRDYERQRLFRRPKS